MQNPRTDLPTGSFDTRMLLRRGIPYGPEVTREEEHAAKSKEHRGLAFAAYNSSIKNGFKFVQKSACPFLSSPIIAGLTVPFF